MTTQDPKPSDGQAVSTLGAYLAKVREAKQLTLRQVEEATESGVSNAYLSQLENDRVQKPSPHILHCLANVYGVPYETLMQKAGYITSSGQHPRAARSGRLPLLATAEPTKDEEEALLEYLAFLRSRRKAKA